MQQDQEPLKFEPAMIPIVGMGIAWLPVTVMGFPVDLGRYWYQPIEDEE